MIPTCGRLRPPTYPYQVAAATLLDRRFGTFSAEGTTMAKFELYKSPNGEYRWRLRATNGQVIAAGGEGYSSKAAAQKWHSVGEARGS